MARRRLIWHLGLAHPLRDVVGASLAEHAAALGETGRQVIATRDQARLATHELLRTHRAAGLARDEVEGRWARTTDRVWEHKGVSLLSTPDLCAADKDQLRLALDPLIGIEVHLVVTVGSWGDQLHGAWLAELASGRATSWETYVSRVCEAIGDTSGHRQAEEFWAGHDLAEVLARWGWTFHAERLHVLADPDPQAQWSGFLDVAGLVQGSEGADLRAVVPPAAEAPAVQAAALRPLAQQWAESLPAAGYDVRGDLAGLGETVGEAVGQAPSGDPAVASLATALAENQRLRARVARLRQENERLDRKRRKHKRRLRQLQASAED